MSQHFESHGGALIILDRKIPRNVVSMRSTYQILQQLLIQILSEEALYQALKVSGMERLKY